MREVRDVIKIIKMKVAFDFDETLDNVHVQEFAKELLNMGIDVHVVTNNFNGQYIWLTTDELGINRDNIHCVGYSVKSLYFTENPDFLFHLDNDYYEVKIINKDSKVKGVVFTEGWKEECLNIIKLWYQN